MAAGSAFASQLVVEVFRDVEARYHTHKGKLFFHYLPMPNLLRRSGAFGTHWMLQPRIRVLHEGIGWNESGDAVAHVIRAMHGDHNDHFQATLGVHTGSVTFARPSLGSWVSYGLGTVNQNLPSFVVLAPQLPYAGSQVWSSDFLPGCHSGTRVMSGQR